MPLSKGSIVLIVLTYPDSPTPVPRELRDPWAARGAVNQVFVVVIMNGSRTTNLRHPPRKVNFSVHKTAPTPWARRSSTSSACR